MGWYWNPLGAMGIVAGLAAASLALVVLFTQPGRAQNRWLALVLLLETPSGLLGGGMVYLTDDVPTAFAAQALTYAATGPLSVAYLCFLSTLPTRVTRWLRAWPVRALLAAWTLTYLALFFLRTDKFIAGLAATPYSRLESVHGEWITLLAALPGMVVALFGFVAALAYWRGAPVGSAARREGALYALAFGLRDAAVVAFLLFGFILALPSVQVITGFAAAVILFYALLAYGILKHQLFAIDLRLKWTLRRGTVAGAFLGAFFVVSEGAQQVFQGAVGPVLGLAAAGLLVFALAPLQRLADRVADRALPGVHDTEEYRTVRRREVYRATLEGALLDGTVTDRERDMLARLQDQLGLTATEARAIEREVGSGFPAGPARV